jgi:imidazolonepropionase-like amidohydrolase
VLNEVELEYVNPGLVEGTPLSPGWLPDNHPYQIEAGADAARRDVTRRYWTAHAEAHRVLFRALVDNDVIVMAGTDANNAVAAPGFSLHDEMKALVNAGMTPAQSLRAATATPSEWMQNRTGKVAPGYRADLVLLDGNPLDDIENTRRIQAVVVGGRPINRAQREAMLESVRQANERSRSVSIDSLTERKP